jgi:hypothetical protein
MVMLAMRRTYELAQNAAERWTHAARGPACVDADQAGELRSVPSVTEPLCREIEDHPKGNAASRRDQRGTTRLEAACADRRTERFCNVLIRRRDIAT